MSWRRKVGLVIRYSMEFGGLKDFCVCISIDGWVFSALIESQFHGSIYLHTLQPITTHSDDQAERYKAEIVRNVLFYIYGQIFEQDTRQARKQR